MRLLDLASLALSSSQPILTPALCQGVVVHGSEYFYAGGIQCAAPGRTPFGPPRKVLPLAPTSLPLAVFEEFLAELAPRFSATTYSLLSNNCNHFSDEVVTFLTGSGIPPHIVGLPARFLSTPFGSMLRPVIEGLERQLSASMGSSWQPGAQAAARCPPAPAPASPAAGGAGPGPAEASAAPSPAPASSSGQAAAPAAGREKEAPGKEAFKRAVQAEFAALMASGSMPANEAAVLALARVKGAWDRRAGSGLA